MGKTIPPFDTNETLLECENRDNTGMSKLVDVVVPGYGLFNVAREDVVTCPVDCGPTEGEPVSSLSLNLDVTLVHWACYWNRSGGPSDSNTCVTWTMTC